MSGKLKLLTFLGTNKYEEVTYYCKQGEVTTKLFPIALVKWYRPKEVLVMLTEEARNCQHKHWQHFQEQVPDAKDVSIPSGNNEAELWEIFSRMTECFTEGDEVIFDPTHSFRSLPILSLLAVAYLRVTKKVEIKKVLYGAYEAGGKETKRAPVFDLTPFVSLLDWITATDKFIKNGDGNELAGLLKVYPDNSVQQLTEDIKKISEGLRLLRPLDVMRRAAELPQHFRDASGVIMQSIPPFNLLAQKVEQSYSRFGVSNPDPQRDAKDVLVRQLKMIEWYLEKEQIVQCLSLAREWVPSLLCLHFDVDPMDEKVRGEMELLLAGGSSKDKSGNKTESQYLSKWQNVPERTRLINLWGNSFLLANLRNDVLHSGFRKKPKDTNKIKNLTGEIVAELKEIATLWKL